MFSILYICVVVLYICPSDHLEKSYVDMFTKASFTALYTVVTHKFPSMS